MESCLSMGNAARVRTWEQSMGSGEEKEYFGECALSRSLSVGVLEGFSLPDTEAVLLEGAVCAGSMCVCVYFCFHSGTEVAILGTSISKHRSMLRLWSCSRSVWSGGGVVCVRRTLCPQPLWLRRGPARLHESVLRSSRGREKILSPVTC